MERFGTFFAAGRRNLNRIIIGTVALPYLVDERIPSGCEHTTTAERSLFACGRDREGLL